MVRLLAAAVPALVAVALGCTQERAPVGSPSGAGVGIGAGASPTGGGGDGGSASTGEGGAAPPPDVDDCACLVGARVPACRSCLEEAAVGACTAESAACDATEPGYCAIVIDCLARCPVADASCADACLGADDTSRARIEALAACACAACAAACGSGDC